MKSIILLILCMLFVIAACNRKGCMDNKADNFNPNAKEENNSCKYTARLVFWSDEHGGSRFSNAGSHTLKYYANDKHVATAPTNIFWPLPPACGEVNATTAEFQMESSTQSVTFKAIDNFEKEMWSEEKIITAGSCNTILVK